MGFTSQIFLFAFFPLLIAVYYPVYYLSSRFALLRKLRAVDMVLIAISFAFYMWTCFDDGLFLCVYILAVYAMGRLIQRARNGERRRAVAVLLICCAVVTGFLCYCKLWGFVWDLASRFLGGLGEMKTVLAPLGISFITFSAISYLADIYHRRAEAGSLIDCALYLSFFTKVVSGPIALWRDFAGQRAEVTLSAVSDGATRVMIGFAKKTVLADTFGYCIAHMAYEMDVVTAWGAAILYMLQIYYDFSGYSDIAIGLAKMLGFHIKENFNFPYLSTSITEFWRRWHISLGTWFREYVYIPLGGSRKGLKRTVVHIAVVFALTGIWHGTGWTYLFWGMINGVCNIIEKLLSGKRVYEKLPKGVKWLGTMGVTLGCWQLFRANGMRHALHLLLSMLGLAGNSTLLYTWQYYFDAQIVIFALIGFLGATAFGLPKVQSTWQRLGSTTAGYALRQLVSVVLFVCAVLFMVNSSYSPFLYFQY